MHPLRLGKGVLRSCFVLAILLTSACRSLHHESALDRLHACKSTEGPSEAYCGKLDVWENRDAKSGRKIALKRVLAIGDSLRTDLAGARDAGLDFLFVTSGIHAGELGARDAPDSPGAAMLRAVLGAAGEMPKAVMQQLVW